MAMATRPAGNGKIEIETGDDFVLTQTSSISGVTFTGLLSGGATAADISQVVVEIYRVFPLDSDTTRTPNVPTRANSPSDVALDSRDSSAGGLTFTTNTLSALVHGRQFRPQRDQPKPNQTTMGEGPVTGAGSCHQHDTERPVQPRPGPLLPGPAGPPRQRRGRVLLAFGTEPIVPPGTPFPPGSTDLQAWIRNENLAPDWLRVGTDIEGLGRTFNASFSLNGQIVPEPSSVVLGSIGSIACLGWGRWRKVPLLAR